MDVKVCKRHGTQLHTEPAKEGRPSYCMKCLAAAVRLRPRSFVLTDSFKRMLDRVEARP